MLEQASSLGLDELSNHIAEDRANGIESLVGGTDVVETIVIKENLLHNKDGNSLAKFRASLHDSEAEGNDLGCEQEVDNFGGVIFHQSPDDAKTGQPEIFEWARLGRGVEERVEEERDVCCIVVSWRGAWNQGGVEEGQTNHEGRERGYRCGMRRTAGGRAHCRRGWRPPQSAAKG